MRRNEGLKAAIDECNKAHVLWRYEETKKCHIKFYVHKRILVVISSTPSDARFFVQNVVGDIRRAIRKECR